MTVLQKIITGCSACVVCLVFTVKCGLLEYSKRSIKMVRNYVRKSDRATYPKEKLLEAVEKVKKGELSAYRASLEYGIPRPTIVSRVHGRYGLKSNSFGRATVIPEAIEQKLAGNLHVMEKHGFGLSRCEIIELVGHYINKNKIDNPFKNGIPGEDWFLSFKKRHNLTVKKPQAVENSRKKACNPWVIYPYFDLLKNTLDELGLHQKPSQIWNLDETSFSKDPSKTKVVGLRGYAATRTIASPGKDNTTVLLGCSAAGDKTPPLIIFKGKHLWDEWTSNEGYPGTVYAATQNGWMETDVFETFFEKVFLPTVGQSRPILLVYDGHSTHVGINIVEKPREAGITILKLPPHTSDNLQPLDLAVNKSFKDKWDLTLVKWQRLHVGQILPKKEFSKLIGKVWTQVDPLVCAAGFRKAGIFPFNRDAVPEEKFHRDQLAEWRTKNLKSCTELIGTSIALDIPKYRDIQDQPLPGPSCSKDQFNHPYQIEVYSEKNVNIVKVPSTSSIPSLLATCLTYWNRESKKATKPVNDYAEIKATSYGKCFTTSSNKDQSSVQFTLNLENPQPNEQQNSYNISQSVECKCQAKHLKVVPLNYDIYTKSQTSPKKIISSEKITVKDDRLVKCNITFEELLLQKIKAGACNTKKRTKVADGAELITSEDVYKKQKQIEEEKQIKLRQKEEKQAKKLNKNGTNTYKNIDISIKASDIHKRDNKVVKNEKHRKTKQFENREKKKYTKKRKLIEKRRINESTSGSDMEIVLREESDLENYDYNSRMDKNEQKDHMIVESEKSSKERDIHKKDNKDAKNKKDRSTKQFGDREKKKKINTNKKKTYQKTKKREIDESTSESDMEIELIDESDLENYDYNTIIDIDEENNEMIEETEKADCNEYDNPLTSTVVQGQWVLVKFATKTSVKHYVGVVTDLTCDGIPIVKYARKSIYKGSEDKTMFVFPNVPDICELRHLEDVDCKLPDPMTGRRGQIFFKISFQGYNVQ